MILKIELENFLIRKDLPMVVVRSDLDSGYPEHTHDFYELVMVLEGRGRQRINGQEFDLEPGMVFLIKDEDRHSFQDCHSLVIYNILSYRSSMEDWLGELSSLAGYQFLFNIEPKLLGSSAHSPFILLDHGEILQIKRILNQMEWEQRNREDGFSLALKGLFFQLATTIFRSYNRKADSSSGKYNRIAAAIAAMNRDFCAGIRIGDLADRCHLSERQFLRIFQEIHGTSPSLWILAQRLAKSKELLRTTKTPIVEIADSCGFQDPNYFSRSFRKAFGTSPSEFRRDKSS